MNAVGANGNPRQDGQAGALELKDLIAVFGDAEVAAYFRSLSDDEVKALTVGFMLGNDAEPDLLRAFVLFGRAGIRTG